MNAHVAADLRAQLVLPAICAPMMIVSGPELVTATCRAGMMGALPRHNARTAEEFAVWLDAIAGDLARYREANPGARVGPVAVNFVLGRPIADIVPEIDQCIAHGIRHFITALGSPAEVAKAIHDRGGVIFHDVTSVRFAQKAAAAGVDGLICIGGGGGGHAGTVNPCAFIPRVREFFDGAIVYAGCVSNGAGIRAAEVLGADLVYLGTRFIATQEARAAEGYKAMLVEGTAEDLYYSSKVTGVPANWLAASLAERGIALDAVPPFSSDYAHLPEGVRPWRDVWSAGQGVELINDCPDVVTLARRLTREYAAACATPALAVA